MGHEEENSELPLISSKRNPGLMVAFTQGHTVGQNGAGLEEKAVWKHPNGGHFSWVS